MRILGLESSCDETAAAIVEDGRRVLSSVVASQVAIHHPYGGVVPELASRKHIEMIVPVVRETLETAGMTPKDVDAVAVTRGPGLVGALLVAFCFGKAFAYARKIPWVGVDHLEGHIHSVFLEPPAPQFPFIALLASGGHTNLYDVGSPTRMTCIGRTFDDAAGEAFDKVAKMLGLGYPGGKVISEIAETGDPEKIRLPRPYLDKDAFDFSFSGLKSAVHRYIETHPDYLSERADIAAAFQASVVDVLTFKVIQAARARNYGRIALVGGVAANRRLRQHLRQAAEKDGLAVFLPSPALCGDNAAMVAAAGYYRLTGPGRESDPLDLDVYSRVARKPK